ncbi:MAG: hypothetical protein JWM66_455, partial [Solirubrobacterales bacterium]|nr:hypothetical protein [Solirubrobacterales bacterium]
MNAKPAALALALGALVLGGAA